MAPPAPFKSYLEASSYHAPGGGELYQPLREKIVKQAVEQGYDESTMIEHAVSWGDDQDPFGHIMNAEYNHFSSTCNFRVFESFEEHLKDKFEDLFNARGIGVIVKASATSFKRQVKYPDSIIVATRMDDVKEDRYHVTTTMWSLRQQAVAAESVGWVVFFNWSTQKPANLVHEGGVYADLYEALCVKSKAANAKKAAWDLAHGPKKAKARI